MNRQDDVVRAFLSDINFDHNSAAKAARGVTQFELKPVAQAFEANVGNAVSLLQLPYSLLMWSHLQTKRLLMFTDIYLPFGLKGKSYDDPEVNRQVNEEVDRRMKELGEGETLSRELIRTSDGNLAHLLREPHVQQKIRMLLLSLISATWTTFEMLAGDAWQLVLNIRPDKIVQEVLRQLFPGGTPEGLSAKGIPIWMAAKYRFDLRNHIGDLLKPRVDFTDIKEIQKAYSAAFGRDAVLESALADKNLLVLEATRHLVVHRAGLVDEKYNKIAKQSFEIDQALPLDATFLSNILGAGIAAGCALITFVDGWLAANPPE